MEKKKEVEWVSVDDIIAEIKASPDFDQELWDRTQKEVSDWVIWGKKPPQIPPT